MTTLDHIAQKFNLDLTKPQPIQISSIGRNQLAELFAELNFTQGAEVGVDRGAYSETLCKANPKLHLIAIDAWSTDAFEDPANRTKTMEIQVENHYQDAVRRLGNYNCDIMREESQAAVKKIADNSLNFVYLDADHNFAKIASDLYQWLKKIKVGGIISGHDYLHFPPTKDNHVKDVVDAFVKAFEISPYFELGVDRYHSWFWVKNKMNAFEQKYQPTELCELGWKYGADKSPLVAHTYTPYYYELLKDKKQSVKKVLELGVGNNHMVDMVRTLRNCPNAQIGASLKMWRDFFPNAQIFGADWQPESIIQDERISTYYADLNKEADILKLLEIVGTDIDLIIDDAGHRLKQQELLASTILPRLTTKDFIYIIEDCNSTELLKSKFHQYNAVIPQFPTRNELNSEWGPLPHSRDNALILKPKLALDKIKY